MGRFLQFDDILCNIGWSKFLRLRVEIDVTQPLVLRHSKGDCFLQNVDSSPSTGLPYGSWLKASPIKRSIQNAMEDYCDRVSNLSQIIARSLLGPGPSFFSDRIPSTTSSEPFDVSLDFETKVPHAIFLMMTKLHVKGMERIGHKMGYLHGIDVGIDGLIGVNSLGVGSQCMEAFCHTLDTCGLSDIGLLGNMVASRTL
ncbi:hypothetical protein Golax_009080 [Gossypium laxum]|uniref:Uncharacterized protein n=1 Tax=Gossypium laxum TaxID=34288 RepID=A0A7J9ADH1_9ROSI|nr:hypothetical protein [Gossypium laxum]